MNAEKTFSRDSVQRLQTVNGVVSRLAQPVTNLRGSSSQESRWRIYTSDSNNIVVTQAGEAYFKSHVGQPGNLGSVARKLHDFIKEGREMLPDDPFEYMEGMTPTRERIGSGGEAHVFRLKGTDLVVKVRLNQGQMERNREEYLEAAEAVRMALELERDINPSIPQAVPIFMMIGPINEQRGDDIDFERPPMELIVMPYVPGVTMSSYINEMPLDAIEKKARDAEYDMQVAQVRDVVARRVSQDIISNSNNPNNLDLSAGNIIRVNEGGQIAHRVFDYVV